MSVNQRSIVYVFIVIVLCALPLAASARPAQPLLTFTTTITVDSGDDTDDSKSKTCSSDIPCTLRRAIVEARGLMPEERPVLIQFDIPKTDASYDSGDDVWIISPMSTTDPSVFRTLEGGEIVIDGSTQPEGRSELPRIFIKGPGTGSEDGLIVGANSAGGHDRNEIHALGFQNFKTHVIVNSNENYIAANWFGLTKNGDQPYLRNSDAQDGSGSAGVALSAGVVANLLTENHFLGFDGVAVAFRGGDNGFTHNYIGLNAAGEAPDKQSDPNLVCTKEDWLGGGGLSMEGNNHFITDNIFAGLRQEISATSTQPDAISVTGTGHLIKDNVIGMDLAGSDVGVCGRGIFLSNSPKQVTLTYNTIVNPGFSSISLNGALYNENELRGNMIRQEYPWTEVDGSAQAESAIQLGKSLPDSLQNFAPARVTSIMGKKVNGTSSPGSPCLNCTIELFLDDNDNITEALQSLGVVDADASGNWSVELTNELNDGDGLRTTSTSTQFNTIPGLGAGTTTGLSQLYLLNKPVIFFPTVMSR